VSGVLRSHPPGNQDWNAASNSRSASVQSPFAMSPEQGELLDRDFFGASRLPPIVPRITRPLAGCWHGYLALSPLPPHPVHTILETDPPADCTRREENLQAERQLGGHLFETTLRLTVHALAIPRQRIKPILLRCRFLRCVSSRIAPCSFRATVKGGQQIAEIASHSSFLHEEPQHFGIANRGCSVLSACRRA